MKGSAILRLVKHGDTNLLLKNVTQEEKSYIVSAKTIVI